jgi:lysophospholipase L1-like esterase
MRMSEALGDTNKRTMARLPQPGGDQDTWGNVLNDFLSQSHNTDGTLKTDSVGPAQLKPSAVASANLADGAVTNQKLDTATQTALGKAATSVQSVNGKTPTSGDLPLATTDLSDVLTPTPANGDVLTYDSVAAEWKSLPTPAAPVTSVAGQTGAVTGAQIAADSALKGTYAPIAGSTNYAPIGLDRGAVSVADRNTAAMRYFRQRLALRESAGCDICITPGDSITEGQGATLLARRWTDRLRDQLRLKFPVSGVAGGYGYIATQNVQTSFTYSLITTAGNPPSTAYGYGRRALQIQNNTQTITLNSIAATAIDVYWIKGGGGSFAWSVDGGGATTVSTAGTPTTPMVTRVLTGGGGTNHTVTLSWISGNSIIAGFNVFNGDETAGIRVHNGGFNGAHLSDFLPADSGQNIWPRYLASTLLNPALVIVPIGANEFKTGDSVSTYQSNLTATVAGIRAYAPSASICLAIEHELGGFTPVNPWTQYVAANYAVAAADGAVAVFDLYQRIGSHTTAETNGLILSSDHQHPSDAGQLFYADALADWLGRV